eukprot:gene22985-30173_t
MIPVACALLFILTFNILDTNSAALACEAGGYCSLGKVGLFRGEIADSKGFKSMLSTVAYKKEIMLTTTISIGNELHIEELVHLNVQLEKLGFGHLLVLTKAEKSCQELELHRPNTSCAWDTSPIHEKGFEWVTHLWHLRWRFFARAIRLEYNVMSFDNDFSVYRDPYLHVKATPFNQMQLLGVVEGLCGMNGGWVYVQNAAPDGPVAWMFQRVTELPLRWMDDNFSFLKTLGRMKEGDGMCLTFAMESWRMQMPRDSNTSTTFIPGTKTPTPPGEMGGIMFNASGGIYSDSFLNQLKEDCDDGACSSWLFKESVERKKETFGLVPKWLSTTSFWMQNGLLTPLDGSTAKVIALHGHVGSPGSSKMMLKRAVRKLFGSFDWEASKALHSLPEHSNSGPYFTGSMPQKLIALSPAIDLSKTRSKAEYKRLLIALIQACAGTKAMSLDENREWMPYLHKQGNPALDQASAGASEFRFVTSQMLSDFCLRKKWSLQQGGMIEVEFEYWLRADAPHNTVKYPIDTNTVLTAGDDQLKARLDNTWSPFDGIVKECAVGYQFRQGFFLTKDELPGGHPDGYGSANTTPGVIRNGKVYLQ